MYGMETRSFTSADEARQHASSSTGPVLVMAPEMLQQITDAEAAGGFVGGMSKADGASAEGYAGPTSSSPSDAPASGEPVEGWVVPGFGVMVEGGVEKFLDLKDLWEAFQGGVLGPVLLVPESELRRWRGDTTGDGA